jgi:hypothetical protein
MKRKLLKPERIKEMKKLAEKKYQKLLKNVKTLIKIKRQLKNKKTKEVTAADLDRWIEKHCGAIE